MRLFLTLLASISLCACQTVTIKSDGKPYKYTSPPDYEESHHFFVNGLIGSARVNVSRICGDREPVQMQTQKTFINQIWPFIWALGGMAIGLTVGAANPSNPNLQVEGLPPEAVGVALGGGVGLLLGSLYTPKTARVWCASTEKGVL